MDVLVFMAGRRDEVLSKETIIDEVWAERYVGDGVLRRQIVELRRALGDDTRHPSYIENIPKRGYRLVARVHQLEPEGVVRAAGAAGSAAGPRDHGTLASRRGHVCALRWGFDDLLLREGRNTIGRAPECDVQIPSDRVSRRHARIVVTDGRAVIEDLGSKNGTFIDGRPLAGPTELTDGAQISIGPAVMTYSGFFTAETASDEVPDAGTSGD